MTPSRPTHGGYPVVVERPRDPRADLLLSFLLRLERTGALSVPADDLFAAMADELADRP